MDRGNLGQLGGPTVGVLHSALGKNLPEKIQWVYLCWQWRAHRHAWLPLVTCVPSNAPIVLGGRGVTVYNVSSQSCNRNCVRRRPHFRL